MIVEVESDELHGSMGVYPTVPNPETYILERHNDACVHLGDDNRCQIYEHRPRACREFDCREDDRFKYTDAKGEWIG